TVSACSTSSPSPKVAPDGNESKARPTEIGPPLFTAAPWPKVSDDASVPDPIRVGSCHLTVLDRVDVPRKEEGTVEWVGVVATNSEIKSLPQSELFLHERTNTVYRRLRIGEV